MKRFTLLLQKPMRQSRGFSLVEVVIAMTVIAAVTISAISVVLSGIGVASKANRRFEAHTVASNAIECFKATDDYEGKGSTLSRLMLFYDNYTFETNVPAPGEGEEPTGQRFVRYTFDRDTYTVTATVFYGVAGERDKLFVSAVEKETRDQIFQTEYVKGSGQV